ncbi:MAG: hypothetical protein ACLPVY_12605 [Acidimicrobiia bacterium]
MQIDAPSRQRGWYIDGGVKLNARIKPALAQGADRVIVELADMTECERPQERAQR